MGFWFSVPLNSSLVTGTYRFTFRNLLGIKSIPLLSVPSSYRIDGKLITITRSFHDSVSGNYIIELQMKENPEPVTIISIGLISIIGLSLVYLNLEKVEKLVESPSVSFAVFVVAAFGALALYRQFKKTSGG